MPKEIKNAILAVFFVQLLGVFIVAAFIWPLYTLGTVGGVLLLFFCIMTFTAKYVKD